MNDKYLSVKLVIHQAIIIGKSIVDDNTILNLSMWQGMIKSKTFRLLAYRCVEWCANALFEQIRLVQSYFCSL